MGLKIMEDTKDTTENAKEPVLSPGDLVRVNVKVKEGGKEFYWYKKVTMLQKFNFEGFLEAMKKGYMLVDFDARSGHNHGTKFRLRQNCLPMLYGKVTEII